MDNKEIRKIVANNVRTLMNQEGLSTTELSVKGGIAQGTISKIINGNTGITVPIVVKLAKALDVDVNDILKGLFKNEDIKRQSKKIKSNQNEELLIGVLSINNKRITCIKDHSGNILGTSELSGGLDLAETSGSVLDLILQAIYEALPTKNDKENDSKLKHAKLNLVTQSYEFEDTRNKFIFLAQKHYKEVILLPDWQITYLADFANEQGISLVTDKGISLSYMHNGKIKKLGGWKFPVYDLGGENWLGVETIRHTIEAAEGYIPMSSLARNVLAKFNGKIEKITETCFKRADSDIYCLFAEFLLRANSIGDETAKAIVERGFQMVYKSIEQVDKILGKQLKIAINGSLANIYKPFFNEDRLITPSDEIQKAKLLADITTEFLEKHGVTNN